MMDIEEIAGDHDELCIMFDRQLADAIQSVSEICLMNLRAPRAPRGKRAAEVEISGMEYPDHFGEPLLPLARWRNSAIWSHTFRCAAIVRLNQSCRTIIIERMIRVAETPGLS
jgi:hypothetical protein